MGFEEVKRAGYVGLSYDDIMEMGMAGDDAGVVVIRAELLQRQHVNAALADKLQPQIQKAAALKQ